MTSAPKREPDDRLADWVDGRMTARERERFAAELRVSAHLRDDLAEYEKTVAAVRAALQAPIHPTNLADRVMARIAADAAAPTQNRGELRAARWWNHPVTWSLASAAAVLLVALLVNSWSDGRAAVPTAMVAEETKDSSLADRGRSVPLEELLRQERKAEEKDPPRDSVTRLTTVPPSSPREGAPGTSLGAQKPPATEPGDHRLKKLDGETGTWEKEVAAAAPRPAEGPSTFGPKAQAPNDAPRGGRPPTATAGVEAGRNGNKGVFGESTGKSDLPKDTEGKDRDHTDSLQGGALERAAPRERKNTDEQAAAGEEPGAAAARGKNGSEPSREVLALVVLQGDALDAAPVVRRADADKDAGQSGGEAKTKSGDSSAARAGDGSTATRGDGAAAAAAVFDAFFAEQMRSVTPSADAPKFALGTVTVRAIGAESTRAAGGASAPAAPSPGVSAPASGSAADALKDDATRAPIERTFVVEGSKEDVAFLLRRLASFARAGNLHLTNGETSVPRLPTVVGGQAGNAPKPDPSAPGTFTAGFVEVTPATRIVLRFRVLRR